MKPTPDNWLRANTHSSNESCSQTISFSTDKKMNSEFKHDYGISPVATALPVSSQGASPQSSQISGNPNNEYSEASRKAPATSNFFMFPQLPFLPKLSALLVALGFVAGVATVTLPSLASKDTNLRIYLELNSSHNPVKSTTGSNK